MWNTISPYLASFALAVMIISLVPTLYRVARYFRTNRDVRRAWYRARGRMMFGIFLIAFSFNQIIQFTNLVTYLICAVLIVFAVANISYGVRAMRYFEQHFAAEDRAWAELEKEKKA